MLKSTHLIFSLLLIFWVSSAGAAIPAPLDDWRKIVRGTPYWASKGSYANLSSIRRWVLTGSSFCEQGDRHILFDRQARFLGYFSNPPNASASQALLNAYRAEFAQNGRIDAWVAGGENRIGYPFALSCNQPLANLHTALARYTGSESAARLWGTWDGMRIGSRSATVSLQEALRLVYQDRAERRRITLPVDILATLTGKILIESGGRARAHSAADAKGIMQLSPQALNDCGLAKRFHFHRMAQIDCAFKLLEQNHRLLEQPFNEVFAHLPSAKRETLYASLLIQAYHGGIGRITALLNDPQLAKPARYFAQHSQNYSAGDIALGMIFHNLGRKQLGFASLYYAVDVGIAKAYACERLSDLAGCD